MFRQTLLTSLMVAMFAAQAPDAAALGAPDVCSWKSNFIAIGAMTTPRAGLVATELVNGSVLVTGGSSRSTTVRSAELFDSTTGTFQSLPDMTTERYFHTATRLPSGEVLIVGGSGGAGAHGATATAETFDPVTKTFRATDGPLAKARAFHTATLMSDGTVLIAGGTGTDTYDLSEIELYDPATRKFTTVATLSTKRSNHTAVRIAGTSSTSDDVLIAGGKSPDGTTTSVEIVAYDPTHKTATVRAAPPLSEARQNHTATRLQDGSVLIVGGAGADYQPVAGVELWNGFLFDTVGQLNHPRRNHHATLLPTGQVLIAGGLDLHAVAPTEVYTRWSGFRDIGNLVTPRFYSAAVALRTGQVLYLGGFDATETNVLKQAELYDPFWAGIGPMNEGRQNHSATLLQDGRVLLAGGGDGGNGARGTAELFDPLAATFTSIGMIDSRTKHAVAPLANGSVLLVGGQNPGSTFLASAEVFDPSANSFTSTASLASPRLEHTATTLADGRVLVAGGFGPTTVHASTEIYSPNAGAAQGSFAAGPAMTRDRFGHAAVRLDNGHVLATGGRSSVVSGITYAIEEFDPGAGAFSAWPQGSWLFTNRRNHTIAALPGQSRAIVAGGITTTLTPTTSFEVIPQGGEGRMLVRRANHAMTPTGTSPTVFWVIGGRPDFSGSPTAAVDKIDAADLSATAMPELGTGRADHTATLLPDGRVLVAGGYRATDGATATAEISKSTICASPPPFGFKPRGKVTFEKKYFHIDPRHVEIRALVGNGGRRNNPAFDIRFELTGRDGNERRIVLGKVAVPKLGPAERTRISTSLPLPGRLPAGAFDIRACVVPKSLLAGECFAITGNVARTQELAQRLQFPHMDTPPK